MNPNEEVAVKREILRQFLPACQPQEGSPANTFTSSECQQLQLAFGCQQQQESKQDAQQQLNILNEWLPSTPEPKSFTDPALFRAAVRAADFTGPTNGVCPGYLQCNMVVLPKDYAFDFLLFCQRNAQACPLLEVCEGIDSYRPQKLAHNVDLRHDIPKYAIYQDGQLQHEVTDCEPYWPDDAVAFLIGCSFSYDGALQEAGIPLKSAAQHKNVPMYRTTIPCTPAGRLAGNMVVSMKPIPCTDITRHVQITGQYPHAHGGPVCVGGDGSAIGIANLDTPEWGDAIEIGHSEVPVFHACGVTPQAVLMESKVPFAITHAAGHMFVSDLPSDLGGTTLV